MDVFRITRDGIESYREFGGQRTTCTHFVAADVLSGVQEPGMLPGHLVTPNTSYRHKVSRYYDTPQIVKMCLHLEQHHCWLRKYVSDVRLVLRQWNADVLDVICDKLEGLAATTYRV